MDILQQIVTGFLIAWASIFGTVSAPESEYGDVVSVIDGDTIVVSIEGKEEFVRYIGIDTPEFDRESGEDDCFSEEAADANREFVEGKEVRLESDEDNRDKYNRLLRYVYVDEVFVNKELVGGGYATALPIPPNTKHASEFYELQQHAQSNGLGMWGVCE